MGQKSSFPLICTHSYKSLYGFIQVLVYIHTRCIRLPESTQKRVLSGILWQIPWHFLDNFGVSLTISIDKMGDIIYPLPRPPRGLISEETRGGSCPLRPSGFRGNSRSFRSALATLRGGWNDPCLFFLSPPLSVFFLYWVYPSIEPIYRLWRPFQDLCRAFKDIYGVSFAKRGL